jgi:uncharacterized membrane protein YfhO
MSHAKSQIENDGCNKISYFSEESAKAACRRQKRWGARVERVYWCEECKAFHLTSQKGFNKSELNKKKIYKRKQRKMNRRIPCNELQEYAQHSITGNGTFDKDLFIKMSGMDIY